VSYGNDIFVPLPIQQRADEVIEKT